MTRLKLIRTFNVELIKAFMLQPEVWDNFTDDMSDRKQYDPEINSGRLWLFVMDGFNLVGTILLENTNLNTLSIHPCLLKSHSKYIREVFNSLFKLLINTPDFINKFVVSIPFSRRIVYNCAKKIGFIDEGINRESFLKNSIFYDQWLLGLTKREIKGLIWAA